LGVFLSLSYLLVNTNNDVGIVNVLVRRNGQVKRSRSLTDTSGGIVVRSVARAEPAMVVTGMRDGDTSKVRANTEENQVLGVTTDTVAIGLRVTELRHGHGVGLVNLLLGSMTDEKGLSSPLDDDGVTLGHSGQIKLGVGQGENVGGSTHGVNEGENDTLTELEASGTTSTDGQVVEGAGVRLGLSISVVLTDVRVKLDTVLQ
jgi:hypothetical protein